MIQRMTAIEAGNKQLNEDCGMAEMPAMPPMNQGTPVSMNVSLNASGTEHVQDLINMMKNAGMGAAEPVSAKMLSPRMDIERLSAMMDEPGESIEEESDVEITDEVWQQIAQRRQELVDDEGMEPEEALEQAAEEIGVDPEELEAWLEMNVEGYANEPDETYQGTEYITKDLSGGLNRQKKAYAKAQPGDNAMAVEAIRAKLMAALSEKKAKPDANKNGIPDYAEDGKGKNDLAKGSKPKKGQVPPQFAKKK